MIPRVLGVGALAAAMCLTPTSPVLQSASVTVDIVGMSFSPGVVKVPLGSTVTWRNQAGSNHTSTSDQGFWSSGTLSDGQSFAHTFTSAGSYPYHCAIHAMMRGTVKVPVKATGSPSSGWTLRWATVKGTGGTTYDVEVRKPGSNKWKALKEAVTKASARYNPAASGRYSVRARTQEGGNTSGWSPVKSLTIS